MFMRHRTFHNSLVPSAEGAMLYQPGATPQDEEVHIRKGLKARFILAYGAGFQPLLTWGSPKSWGVAPGWVWVGPSALGETNLSDAMRALDLGFPAVPSRRYQMPYLCPMLCTSNISYLRATRDTCVPRMVRSRSGPKYVRSVRRALPGRRGLNRLGHGRYGLFRTRSCTSL